MLDPLFHFVLFHSVLLSKTPRNKIRFSIYRIETHIIGFFGLISWNLGSIETIGGEENI